MRAIGSTDSEFAEAPRRLETENIRMFLSAELVARYLSHVNIAVKWTKIDAPPTWIIRNIANGACTINLNAVHELSEIRRQSIFGEGQRTSFVLQLKITIAPSELPRYMRLPLDENAAD